MPTVRLTDKSCMAAKAEPGKRLELWDEQERGLALRVSDRGVKTWMVRYRTPDGRQPRLKIGTFPATSLAAARDAARAIKKQVEAGGDPAAEKRSEKVRIAAQPIRTFDDLADAYLDACEKGHWTPKGKVKSKRTLADDRAVRRRYLQEFGCRRLDEISRADVKQVLRGLADRGITAQTNRTQAFIRQVFAYGIAEFEGELVAVNPALGFTVGAKSTPRTRTLSDAELKAFWRGVVCPKELTVRTADGTVKPVDLDRPTAIALQLAALLLQRRAEVVGMRLSELDLERGTWLIPAERMKGRRSHLVPLPAPAVALIREAIKIKDEAERTARVNQPGDPVFPSPRDRHKPFHPDGLTHAMQDLTAALGIVDATVHDLRRTGATVMTSERLGVLPFIRSKVLGHSGDTGGGAAVSMVHYDANEYVAEKRRALEAWAHVLLGIAEAERPSADQAAEMSAA